MWKLSGTGPTSYRPGDASIMFAEAELQQADADRAPRSHAHGMPALGQHNEEVSNRRPQSVRNSSTIAAFRDLF